METNAISIRIVDGTYYGIGPLRTCSLYIFMEPAYVEYVIWGGGVTQKAEQ